MAALGTDSSGIGFINSDHSLTYTLRFVGYEFDEPAHTACILEGIMQGFGPLSVVGRFRVLPQGLLSHLFHGWFAENQRIGFRMGDYNLTDLVLPIFQLMGQFAAHPTQFGLIPMPFPAFVLAMIPFGLHGGEFPAPVFVRTPIRDLEEFPLRIDRRH